MPQVVLTAQDIQIYDGDGLDLYARTGATSAEQIYRAGATGAILGHSEVGDSPDIVHAKLRTLLLRRDVAPDITILVGETWNEFEQHSPSEIAEKIWVDLMHILRDTPQDRLSRLVVGYEPKWGSRGSGRDDMPPPSPQAIGAVCTRIRTGLVELLGEEVGRSIPLIYGGRSTPERTEEILQHETIEGLILGSACSTVEKTLAIADVMERVRRGRRKILHANFKAYNLTDSYEAYLEAFRRYGSDFTIYLSPCVADLREVSRLVGASV